jgi:predicted CXXCH cytochrome family protein
MSRPRLVWTLPVLLVLVACAGRVRRREAAARQQSNILRADYAGSEACAPCHPAIFAAWQASPMHNMTRLPAGATVRAPFDGREFSFRADRARFEQRDTDRYVDVHSVMVGERPGLRAGGVWNQTCVLCHNTAPLFDSLWGALHGPGGPSYQGVVVDRLLPEDRRFSLAVTDPAGLTTALRDEVRFVSGSGAVSADGDPRPLLAEAARTLRERLVPDQLVEVGIGCEACHGGSRAHVSRNTLAPSFAPRAPFLEARPPPGQATVTRAEWINRACARCHQVLLTRYPYTWEGGSRRHPTGGSHITSGEARDFLLGGCARQMSCAACHDPHGADDPRKLQALATPAGNTVCAGCHPAYATAEALRAHSHHDPSAAGGACVGCHLPRKNLGLGYELTRYHRIGSPTDQARVEADRPLECALCHPSAHVDQLVGTMESWWGRRYDRTRLRALYGSDLAVAVLPATVARGKPHEQATALAVMGEARLPGATAPLAAALAHPYPLVRYYARRALEKVRGAPVPIDLDQDAASIRIAVARWLGTAPPPPSPAGPAPSLDADED